MAKICRISILAFIFGDIPMGRENGYTEVDLIKGIEYCEGWIGQGITHDHEFDFREYILWAKKLLGEANYDENERIHAGDTTPN